MSYDYFECRDCGFDSVQRSDFDGRSFCPICEGDCGHAVVMTRRPALDSDQPEGFDARKGSRAEQEARLNGAHHAHD